MIDNILAKIFGTKHEREVKALRPIIAAINDLEPQMQGLSMEELAAQTVHFRQQLAQGATLDDILIPAFATASAGATVAVEKSIGSSRHNRSPAVNCGCP